MECTSRQLVVQMIRFSSSILRLSMTNSVKSIRHSSTEIEPQPTKKPASQAKPNITLCGLIERPPTVSNDGSSVILVRTSSPDSKRSSLFALHRVLLFKDFIRFVSPLTERDRVYLNGLIIYSDFVASDQKKRYATTILASDFYVCRPSATGMAGLFDINEVKLFGRLLGPVRNVNGVVFLDVGSRYFNTTQQAFETAVHKVAVMDENLQSIANSLEVGATLVVNGHITTKRVETNEGKKVIASSIIPRLIFPCEQ